MQNNANAVGFISALSVAAFTIWFMIAFALYAPAVMSWSGIESFSRSFDSTLYILWVVPCLLLALSFPVLGVSIMLQTDEKKRVREGMGYALMGLAFVFQSFYFDNSGLGRWIRILLLVNGTITVLPVVVALIGFPAGTWIALAIWGVTFPIGIVLVAVYFNTHHAQSVAHA
jgi:hypothetical protein